MLKKNTIKIHFNKEWIFYKTVYKKIIKSINKRNILYFITFRYNYFPNRIGGVHGFGGVPPSRRAPTNNPDRGRHAWGQGRPLGGDH